MPAPARVLVVEHDLTTLHRVSGALRGVGFEVEEALDVADALDALAHRRYAVVLADYDMPNIAGLNLLAALQGAAPTTPRILCADLTRELLAQARTFGIVAVLAKPVPSERLIVVVGAAVASGRASPLVATKPTP